jgi:rRNA maturation endonuclease Nob1
MVFHSRGVSIGGEANSRIRDRECEVCHKRFPLSKERHCDVCGGALIYKPRGAYS